MEGGWEELVIIMSKDCMRGENLKVRCKEEKVQVKTVSKLNTICGGINEGRVRTEY